ncbi:BnaC05g08140D [Brassica napus]|uniref:BnaC05g08140D protein n=1 Tax=Brassica napus TaxID=3708 RepID=A0A078HHU3_BRANA|nr:BnaC05g08140D [Brassica napus]
MTRVELKERIDLTEKEQKMFDLLLDALRENNCDTRLRVAGGWYFYLFHFSNTEDIDIAIDNMTGSRFLEKFQNYFSRKVGEKVNVHIIKSKSKHLETGKMRLYDQWIDFEQLRKEEPDENSRIPTKYFGTPEEDAYRRDLTINRHVLSIFILEDLTGRGIDDLKSGRTTTPSPAKTIFLEDPLRVRRAIRFGICFGFTLDEELKDAASSEEIRVALERKICRERIGNEIDMMISGNGPVSAVTYLSDFKLFEVVFAIPSSSEPAPTENCGSLCRAYMEAMWNLIQTPGLFDSLANKTCSLLHDAETVINIHNAAERFLPLILPLQLKDPFQLVNVDWATDVLEHWESISLNDPEVPATSKIRVVTGVFLHI